jgi:hypothetical protein
VNNIKIEYLDVLRITYIGAKKLIYVIPSAVVGLFLGGRVRKGVGVQG